MNTKEVRIQEFIKLLDSPDARIAGVGKIKDIENRRKALVKMLNDKFVNKH